MRPPRQGLSYPQGHSTGLPPHNHPLPVRTWRWRLMRIVGSTPLPLMNHPTTPTVFPGLRMNPPALVQSEASGNQNKAAVRHINANGAQKGHSAHGTIPGGVALLTKRRDRRESDMTSLLVALLVILQFVYIQSKQLGLNIRSLPQGLRIEHDGGIHYQTAEWVVLATLDSPRQPNMPSTLHLFSKKK